MDHPDRYDVRAALLDDHKEWVAEHRVGTGERDIADGAADLSKPPGRISQTRLSRTLSGQTCDPNRSHLTDSGKRLTYIFLSAPMQIRWLSSRMKLFP
jgi:hypothetical protein